MFFSNQFCDPWAGAPFFDVTRGAHGTSSPAWRVPSTRSPGSERAGGTRAGSGASPGCGLGQKRCVLRRGPRVGRGGAAQTRRTLRPRSHLTPPLHLQLREIRKYQKSTELLIRKLPFARLVSPRNAGWPSTRADNRAAARHDRAPTSPPLTPPGARGHLAVHDKRVPVEGVRAVGAAGDGRGVPRRAAGGREPVRHPRQAGDDSGEGYPAGAADPGVGGYYGVMCCTVARLWSVGVSPQGRGTLL